MPKSNHINFKKKYLIRRASKLNFSGDYHHDALLLPIDSNLLPKDLLTLGHISGAVGIKGDLKFILKKPLKYNLRLASFESMLKTLKKFWLVGDSSYLFTINFVINNDRFFKLNFEEIKTRSNAENFVGYDLEISEKDFLNHLDKENINHDILNYKILNLEGKSLGVVDKVDGNGFHDWIFSGSMVIPLVEKHVKKIDKRKKEILVDWEFLW